MCMTVQYLIDSENVGDFWIPLLDLPAEKMELVVFYTRNSPHMSYDSLIRLKESDRKVTFIKCYEGTNALDFQLVSELGYRICENEDGRFVIVTNDTGFDAAVKYWRRRKKTVKRITGKECRNLERRNREDFSPERAQLQAVSADEEAGLPEKKDIETSGRMSGESSEQEGRSSRPNLRDAERALSSVLEDENLEEGVYGISVTDEAGGETGLLSRSLDEEDAEADRDYTGLDEGGDLSFDSYAGLAMEEDDDPSSDPYADSRSNEDRDFDSDADFDSDRNTFRGEDSDEDEESFAEAYDSSDEKEEADSFGKADTDGDVFADTDEEDSDISDRSFKDEDRDPVEDLNGESGPDTEKSKRDEDVDLSEKKDDSERNKVVDLSEGKDYESNEVVDLSGGKSSERNEVVVPAGEKDSGRTSNPVRFTDTSSGQDESGQKDTDLTEDRKELSLEDDGKKSDTGDLAAVNREENAEEGVSLTGNGSEQADENTDEAVSESEHHQRSRRSKSRRSKSGTRKTEQVPEKDKEEEKPSVENVQTETALEAPSEEEIARIAACIGADNLAELHNQLAAIYGEQGKDIYLSIRKNPRSIPVLKADLRQKYAWYCEIIFSRSDYSEEYPKDLPDFLLGVREKLNSLNSLRYALLKQYGKEKGRRFYYLLKPYAKTMYQM